MKCGYYSLTIADSLECNNCSLSRNKYTLIIAARLGILDGFSGTNQPLHVVHVLGPHDGVPWFLRNF